MLLENHLQHKYIHRAIASVIMKQTGKLPYDLGIDEKEIADRIAEQIEELAEMGIGK